MSKAVIQLLGLAPDADPTTQGILTACMGVVPSLKGMKGAPSPASAGLATVAATCLGAALCVKLDGTTRIFSGTGTKLYEAQTSTWADVSRSAAYNTASTSRWRFAQQDNVSFAANGSDTLQASVSTGAFSCISGGPVAAIVETVNKFVFAANTTSASNAIQWSGINAYTTWAASVSTQAGNTSLNATPGAITAVRRFGSAVVVYKKNSMYFGAYAGAPNVWEFNPIPGSAGAMSQESVVNIGTPENPKHIFMGEDDFYLYDGAKPVPIGTARLKQHVFSSIVQSRYYACTTLHDKTNTRVYFFYPTIDSAFPNTCVVYNYRTDKWGQDDRQVEATLDFVSPSVTYSGAGTVISTYGTNLNLAYGLAFAGSSQTFPAIVDTTHVLKTMTGPAGSTSFTTGDLGDDENVTLVTRIIPRFITAPTSATITNFYRMRTGDSLSMDNTTSLTSGKFDFLREARWHRMQFDLVGDWEMSTLSGEWETGGLE